MLRSSLIFVPAHDALNKLLIGPSVEMSGGPDVQINKGTNNCLKLHIKYKLIHLLVGGLTVWLSWLFRMLLLFFISSLCLFFLCQILHIDERSYINTQDNFDFKKEGLFDRKRIFFLFLQDFIMYCIVR